VIQYESLLKIERYGGVQVVLLSSLSLLYQKFRYEVDLKYDDRDIVSSSIVFRSSKWNGASGNPLLEFFYKPKLLLSMVKIK
jgi:hypothetical protein